MTKPTCRELINEVKAMNTFAESFDSEDKAKELAARIERVLELHSKRTSADSCHECLEFAPCPTVRLLDGEDRD